MKIDALIAHLNMVKERHGNLNVLVAGSKLSYGSYGPYIKFVDRLELADDYYQQKDEK